MKKGTKIKDTDSKIAKNIGWEGDEQILCNNKMCKFSVQYLGAIELKECKEEYWYQNAMKKLISKKKKQGELKVSTYSVLWQEKNTNTLILDQTMKNLIFCESYLNIPFSFYYVTEDPFSDICQLYGFISNKEMSARIVSAILYAKQLFGEKQIDIIEIPKPFPSSQEDLNTMFKQATLAEKYQDPQSSILIPSNKIKSSKTLSNLKSIPRPRGGKSTERKVCVDNFQKFNQGDLCKRPDMSSRSVDSKFVTPRDYDLEEIFGESCKLNSVASSGFSSDERLQKIHNINEAFHIQNQSNKVSDNLPTVTPLNVEPFFKENGSSQDSRYDSFKNLSSQAASGWSEHLVKVEENKPKLSKSYNGYFNQINIPDIFNMTPMNSQSHLPWKK